MAVLFVFGKPGAGKSYWGLAHIIKELTTSPRTVVTNLAIRPGELNAYLQDSEADVMGKLRIISNDDLKEWWRYRGKLDPSDPVSPWTDLAPPEQSGKTNFVPSPGPVLYVLDEIHIAFNARAWTSTGPAALFYLSQHRKLGDDVVLISQTPGQVDKQLRALSQEWIHLINLQKLKLMLMWCLPNRLLWKSFSNQPTRGEPIVATGLLYVDRKGMANCYDTACGAGIAGGGNADKNAKRRGMPWQTLALLPLIGMGLWFGGSKLFSVGFQQFLPQSQPTVHPKVSQVEVPRPPADPIPISTPAPEKAPEPALRVTHWYRAGPYAAVFLSDGTKADTKNGLLEGLSKSHATVNGTKFPLP